MRELTQFTRAEYDAAFPSHALGPPGEDAKSLAMYEFTRFRTTMAYPRAAREAGGWDNVLRVRVLQGDGGVLAFELVPARTPFRGAPRQDKRRGGGPGGRAGRAGPRGGGGGVPPASGPLTEGLGGKVAAFLRSEAGATLAIDVARKQVRDAEFREGFEKAERQRREDARSRFRGGE